MLEAGMELDTKVAEKVMGHTVTISSVDNAWESGPDINTGGHTDFLRRYSSDISAAWQVVGAFEEVDVRKGPHGWLCRLERGDDDAIQMGETFRAASAPLAICRAALDAVGSDG